MPRETGPRRKIIIEFLKVYKNSPCLWDSSHPLYLNKQARNNAHETLRKIYSKLVENATIAIVKRKLEHMRSTYSRENKKVIASLVAGGKKHKPVLWYYNHLQFLDRIFKGDLNVGSLDEHSVTIESDDEPEAKKSKLSKNHSENSGDEESSSSEGKARRVSGSFGRTIDLQLSELTKPQRYLAEKLISEVMYLAGLQELNEQTTIGIET